MNWEAYNTKKLKGEYLFRFLSEKWITEFLKTGKLWFARADTFGDKMECFRLSDLKESSFDYPSIEDRKKKHLICCFHEGDNESLAMWDTYFRKNEDRRNYALRFDREKLVKLIEEKNKKGVEIPYDTQGLIHGKVLYKRLVGLAPEKVQTKTVKHVAFRKEASFSYEREYRFDIRVATNYTEAGFGLPLDEIKKLNFEILINPFLNKTEYQTCTEYIATLGFESNIVDSELAKWLNVV